jgi:hypothetical protein
MEAILAGGTRVFFLSSGSIKSEQWAAAIIECRAKLLRIIKKTPGPFISRITSEGRVWGTERVEKQMVQETAMRAYEKKGRKKD